MDGEVSAVEDISDSNSSSQPSPPSKRARYGNGSTYTTKFKGVVPHQNGHWGCQIYANHHRIWLGTFKSEKEAAAAYDSAAMKLRSEPHRNFPVTYVAEKELIFQSHHSAEAVLNMIKDGTYPSKFAEFITYCSERVDTELSLDVVRSQTSKGQGYNVLFEKELTPSDVGKLNRLVIPKKYAVKFFPPISEGVEENEVADKVDDTQLTFYDKSMKQWKFRYCYWKSSQSYVFTKGWSRFVRAKKLESKDVVAFSWCKWRENTEEPQTFYMIDVNSTQDSNSLVDLADEPDAKEAELQLHLGQTAAYNSSVDEGKGEQIMMEANPMNDGTEKNGFKLFGIKIM